MQVIGYLEKEAGGARENVVCVVEREFQAVHIAVQFWSMLGGLRRSPTNQKCFVSYLGFR